MSRSANNPRPLPVVNFTSQSRLVCSISTLGDKAHCLQDQLSPRPLCIFLRFRSQGLTILGLNRRAGSRVTRAQTSCTGKPLTLAWTVSVIASHRINRMAHIVSFQGLGQSQRVGLHVKIKSIFFERHIPDRCRNVVSRATGGSVKVQRLRINMGASRPGPETRVRPAMTDP